MHHSPDMFILTLYNTTAKGQYSTCLSKGFMVEVIIPMPRADSFDVCDVLT